MKSRFLNVSPRAYIRQKDSKNILPPIVRTGYQGETGEENSPFSEDNNTQIFENNRSLLAPYMIPENIAAMSGFLTGSLILTASIRDRSAYLDKKIENRQIKSFTEGSNPAAYNKNEAPGFPAELYPGFSSPDSDKTALVFDISTSTSFDIIKLNAGDSNLDPAGPFSGKSGSGFLYYNHETKSWEDIGTRDPATGNAVDYDPVFQLDENLALPFAGSAIYKIASGTNTFLGQFAGSPYSLVSEDPLYRPSDDGALEARGYHRIGEPTSFFEAPYAPRYHATTGSALRLSNYINAPFVLDRISVRLPVTALRTQDPRGGIGATDHGFGRDIDNYVFFVYVQNRSNATLDSSQDVSSSVRYLVGKESFCFFNRNTLEVVRPNQPLLHSAAQFYSFDLPYRTASISGATVTKSINANIDMTFRPLTFNSVFGTTSKHVGSAYKSGTGSVTGSIFVQNFWRGGQAASGSTGLTFVPINFSNLNMMEDAVSPVVQGQFCKPSPRPLVSSFWEGSNASILSGSGLGNFAGVETSTVSDFSTSKITPVVLFPDDEIVFGIDSGANSNMASPGTGRSDEGTDTSVLSLTGSRVTIRAGDAQVVLYGSLISNNSEHLPVLNQHLGSAAVSEDIHEAGPFDQFDILSPAILSASYVDSIFAGSVTAGNRHRVSLASRGEAWVTGSLQRNVRHGVADLVFFDTFFPSGESIADGIENASFETSIKNTPAVIIIDDAANGFAFQNNRVLNTLLGRSFTYEKDATSARLRSVDLVLKTSGGSLLSINSGDSARFILYYNGKNSNTSVPVALSQKKYSGAASIRYGMQNVRITGPSAVFRRDHYGHFRDMLEQPRDGRFVSSASGKDSLQTAVVVAQFVSGSSDTVVDPASTQCSNLSQFCTSSVPYNDGGAATNRGALPAIPSGQFGPNNLVFGVDRSTALGSASTLSLIG